MNSNAEPRIAVLGASGLIGRVIVDELRARKFGVVGVARRFAPGQRSPGDDEVPLLSLDVAALAARLRDWNVGLVVNCIGVLQDGPGSDTRAVHLDFVGRLTQAMLATGRPIRLVHISIPGDGGADRTAFSGTKRAAEALIKASQLDYAILRPGFVIASSAYGGSAMMRALAALPLDLPAAESATSFQPVAAADIAATVAWLFAHDGPWREFIWDVMQPRPATLGDVIGEFRRALGTAGGWRVRPPRWLLDLGARLGDAVSLLGWTPPLRSTAIAELRRGVSGDPSAWMAATGISPTDMADAIGGHGATIQEKWFARLYLVKALMVGSLALFWIASGFIALFISYAAARGILLAHQFPAAVAGPITVVSSLTDMSVGVLIAIRRSCRLGLVAGIMVSLGYLAGAAWLTPDLWIEPLGALVKTIPAIVLMLATLLILENR